MSCTEEALRVCFVSQGLETCRTDPKEVTSEWGTWSCHQIWAERTTCPTPSSFRALPSPRGTCCFISVGHFHSWDLTLNYMTVINILLVPGTKEGHKVHLCTNAVSGHRCSAVCRLILVGRSRHTFGPSSAQATPEVVSGLKTPAQGPSPATNWVHALLERVKA